MIFIREFISSMKAGWYSGKGHKATRRGEFGKALQYYEVAAKYEQMSEYCCPDNNPVTLECITRTYARLGNLKEALLVAENGGELVKRMERNNNLVADSANRMEHFIFLLKSGKPDDINKFLAL